MTTAKARRGRVALVRALSKLGLASRSDAGALIRDGRVRVDGQIVTEPRTPVVPESIRVAIDEGPVTAGRSARRVLAFHKPRGVVTTRKDPDGRRTIFDVVGEAGHGLIAVGRLDLASTGLLLLTNDTQLANALTDPRNAVIRRYVVTVRGLVTREQATAIEGGVFVPATDGPRGGRERLRAARVEIRKASRRETHLIVDLVQGRNREVRRLFEAIGHDVTRLHRIRFGDVEIGSLPPGGWRDVTDAYSTSRPNRRSQRSASRQPGQTASTSRQKRRE